MFTVEGAESNDGLPKRPTSLSPGEMFDLIERLNKEEELSVERAEEEPQRRLIPLDSENRDRSIDQLRFVLVAVLIFHNAVLEVVANSPTDIERTSPNQFTVIALWMGVYRSVFVAMMYFTSGCASSISINLHDGKHDHLFLLKKLGRMVLLSLGFYAAAWVAEYFYGRGGAEQTLLSVEGVHSYYATQIGQRSLLYAPIYYAIFHFFLDTIYVIGRQYNRRRGNALRKLIEHEISYRSISTRTLITLRIIYPALVLTGYINQINIPISSFAASISKFITTFPIVRADMMIPIDAVNFPWVYAIAYFTGVNFQSIQFYCKNQPYTGALYPTFSLPARLAISVGTLYPLYRYFPAYIPQAVSPKLPPNALLPITQAEMVTWSAAPAILFVLWSAYTYNTLSEMVFSMLYAVRPNIVSMWGLLGASWGRLARIPILIHMLVVIGIARWSASEWIQGTLGLLSRCLLVGVASVLCTWALTVMLVCVFVVIRLPVSRLSSKMKLRRGVEAKGRAEGIADADTELDLLEGSTTTPGESSTSKFTSRKIRKEPLEEKDKDIRVPIIDMVRAILLVLLVVHASITEVISWEPAYVEHTYLRLYVFASFFTAFRRASIIPLLFFISGFSSYISLSTRYRNHVSFFIVKKCGTAVYAGTAIFLIDQSVRWVDGKVTALYGPLQYLTALFMFDCLYAVVRDFSRQPSWLYLSLESKKSFVVVASLLVLIAQIVYPAFVPDLFSIARLTDQHDSLPLLCVLGYFMGINASTVATFYTRRKFSVSLRTVLVGATWRVLLLTMALYVLYFHIFPDQLPPHIIDVAIFPMPLVGQTLDGTSTIHRMVVMCYMLWSISAYFLLADFIASVMFCPTSTSTISSSSSYSATSLGAVLSPDLDYIIRHPIWFTSFHMFFIYWADITLHRIYIDHTWTLLRSLIVPIIVLYVIRPMAMLAKLLWNALDTLYDTFWRISRNKGLAKNKELVMRLREEYQYIRAKDPESQRVLASI